MTASQNSLHVICPAFGKSGQIPKRYTGFGEDISPQFSIGGLRDEMRTLAIMMDDLDVPFVGELNHWLIWNLPPGTPSEMAARLMEQVQTYVKAADDMTILVVGIWKR